mmetsp:Transcript_34726/g.91378  ORF Transcript_34726/g.91378 Transcript_34726/m.91378 type:complete len:356 (-) Transcript_34726:89-1156(-)
MVHQQHCRLGAARRHRLVEVLPRRRSERADGGGLLDAHVLADGRRVDVGEGDQLLGFFKGRAGVAGVRLADSDHLLVRDERPDGVLDRVVVDVVRERERRRDDHPRAKVRARLLDGEADITAERRVQHAHLQHVRVRPATWVGQILLCVRHRALQVADHRTVVRTHVARRAVKVPRAPRRIGLVRHLGAPMAILDHDGVAAALRRRRLDDIVPQLHVRLRPATVELVRVEAEVAQLLDVALVKLARADLAIRTDAVVAIPARREAERVRLVRHVLHGGEAVKVDDRAAVLLVVLVALRPVRAALLPVVVEANIAVTKVTEGGGNAVDREARVTAHHALHDDFDLLLVDIAAVEVP